MEKGNTKKLTANCRQRGRWEADYFLSWHYKFILVVVAEFLRYEKNIYHFEAHL
jgi:hypothetical protein